jgi:hypothetical protein
MCRIIGFKLIIAIVRSILYFKTFSATKALVTLSLLNLKSSQRPASFLICQSRYFISAFFLISTLSNLRFSSFLKVAILY